MTPERGAATGVCQHVIRGQSSRDSTRSWPRLGNSTGVGSGTKNSLRLRPQDQRRALGCGQGLGSGGHRSRGEPQFSRLRRWRSRNSTSAPSILVESLLSSVLAGQLLHFVARAGTPWPHALFFIGLHTSHHHAVLHFRPRTRSPSPGACALQIQHRMPNTTRCRRSFTVLLPQAPWGI